MLPEETLHVRRKFALKIPNRIRDQRTTKSIHGIPESAVISWIVGILQPSGGQNAQKLGCVEGTIAVVVLGDHHSGC
jgi:hypothetical protein